jgi:hypothetical protein
MKYNVSDASHSGMNCSYVSESSMSDQMLKCQTHLELRCDVIVSVPDEKKHDDKVSVQVKNNVSLPFETHMKF